MTEKVKVSEIAEELGITSKDVLKKASELKIEAKAANSSVTMEDADNLMKFIMNGKVKAAAKPKVVLKKVERNTKATKVNYEDIEISRVLEETGLNQKELKTRAKDLDITINSYTKTISEAHYNKIIDDVKISFYEIAKVYGLSIENIMQYAKAVGIDFDNSQFKMTTDESKKIMDYIFKERQDALRDTKQSKMKYSSSSVPYSFNYKNILLKGVPGTGKSRAIDKIIENKLNIKNEENILRINVHSSSSNADLMQGIGINSDNGSIEYREKQGLILGFIQKATFNPLEPFALVLEEIQENSLNELIGDLIYLIEVDKRSENISGDDKLYTYDELVEKMIRKNTKISIVNIPNLVDYQHGYKKMLLPNNIYIFCTSNYRDDKKVIEDNLLRRFDVIEVYPKYKSELKNDFKNQYVSDFLEELNKSIIDVCSQNGEIHPDRFMIGHSIWLKVEDKQSFNRAFLKVLTEFKDVKDFYFEDFKKITENINFPFSIQNNYVNY